MILSTISVQRAIPLFVILVFSFISDSHSQSAKAEILWDHYGVPHIYGKNSSEMYYAFGWAQMTNHANLILKLYAQARGKAAEYMGEEYFDSDRLIHLFKIPDQALQIYGQQDPEYKSYLDSFVNGINDYAKAHPEAIEGGMKQVLPISAIDVISHMTRIVSLEFVAKEDIVISEKSSRVGSNAYAIAPSKSASKNAMLVSNSHLPWSDYFLWFEAHLNTNGFSSYGIALVGMPSISMGFNNNLGWTFTVNPIDCSDRYELTLRDDGYVLDGKIMKFETGTTTIKVKQKDGSLKENTFDFKYSIQGPVVGQKNDKAYAVRIAGFENPFVLEQYHKMNKASNFEEFESALRMQQISMFNIVYADKAGNIFYIFNGNIPVREEGDFRFWKGTIDGTQSKYIWNSTHSYNDLPKSLNPASGFLQNCNDAPWTCTEPPVLTPEKYPAYISSNYWSWRSQRAVNMVKNIPSISYDELIDIKHNTGMESAERFLDDLFKAVENYPDSMANSAVSVLKAWDRKTEIDSKGAILFAGWWDKINGDMFEIRWDDKNPNATPDGLKDQKKAVELLIKAANEVTNTYGSMDVAWGEVDRYRMYGLDYPANGGPGDQYGIFRTISFADDRDGKKFAVHGETFVAVTEFGEKVKSMVLLSYGNATQPGNKHRGDQLKMLSEKKLRPALLEKPDIMKNLEKRDMLK